MENIGTYLKDRRKELDLTLDEVAEFVGVTKSTVSRWERGVIGNMRRDRIYRLAQVLRISPAEIMGFTETELRAFEKGDLLAYASDDPYAIELLSDLKQMTPKDRRRVLDFANALLLSQ